MDNIFLYNQRGESFSTDVIRYFTLNGNKYFIFTLNEKDESGYVQLYASRIENEDGKVVMKNITDENEWSSFKSAIQNIVTNNRNNIKNTTDLDFSELNNIVVTEFRIFKLKEAVAKELAALKNVVKVPEKKEPTTLEAASAQNTELSIEEILKQVSDGARSAKEVSTVNINTEVKPQVINDVMPFRAEEVKTELPKVEPIKPVVDYAETKELPKVDEITREISQPTIADIDYKKKYDDLLKIMKNLEAENMKLINDLVEAKAKIETIKDIITD